MAEFYLVYIEDKDGLLVLACPHNSKHILSADAEPHSYYCYQCGEHYTDHPANALRAVPGLRG